MAKVTKITIGEEEFVSWVKRCLDEFHTEELSVTLSDDGERALVESAR